MFYDSYSIQNWIMFFIVIAIIVAFVMYVAGLVTNSSAGTGKQGMLSQSGTSKSTSGGSQTPS